MKWIGHVRCEKTRCNFGSTKWCIVCTPKPDLTTGTSLQQNRTKPPRNLVWPNEVDWACLLRENKTQLREHKVVHCMHPKTRSHNGYLRQQNRAKPPRNLVLGLKKWIGHVRCEKTRCNFGSTKWCILCTPKPDLTTGTSQQWNRTKPPRNLVWPNEVDWACSLRKKQDATLDA